MFSCDLSLNSVKVRRVLAHQVFNSRGRYCTVSSFRSSIGWLAGLNHRLIANGVGYLRVGISGLSDLQGCLICSVLIHLYPEWVPYIIKFLVKLLGVWDYLFIALKADWRIFILGEDWGGFGMPNRGIVSRFFIEVAKAPKREARLNEHFWRGEGLKRIRNWTIFILRYEFLITTRIFFINFHS
jgi:hypothetical protein